MNTTMTTLFVGMVLGACTAAAAQGKPQRPDPRLREVIYDPKAVVTVTVQRGVVVLVEFDADEAITDVAAGLGSDCSKADAVWCVAAQPGGRHVFVKAKRGASAPNNLAVVTDRRSHSLRFEVLADDERQPPVYRLSVKAPARPKTLVSSPTQILKREMAELAQLPAAPAGPTPEQLVTERLQARPAVVNTRYAVAEGKGSSDIVPSLVFDDGRFTYLRMVGQRPLPAVFEVQGDGSEHMVNTRMEEDLLVVDRVSRRLMLRAGHAAVGIWNEAYEQDREAPTGATTVPGVERSLKKTHSSQQNPMQETQHVQ